MDATGGPRSATPQAIAGQNQEVGGLRGATPRGSSSSASSGQGSGTEAKGSDGGSSGLMEGPSTPVEAVGISPTPRSLSLASISSDGSTESHLVEQEDIIALCSAVRAFKEALGKLRKIFEPDREKSEALKVVAHERLGEVLRILRNILERYSPVQHNELLGAASQLITHVNGFDYKDEEADPAEFIEAIDHLALTFSTRVSDYLMGDIDTNPLNCSSAASSSRTKSCDNLQASDAESSSGDKPEAFSTTSIGTQQEIGSTTSSNSRELDFPTLQEIDDILFRHDKGVELALHRAKVWSKYAKDIVTYIEKKSQLYLDFARNQSKLAVAVKPMLKEESFLPLQTTLCSTLDQDVEISSAITSTYSLLQTSKFIEPLTAQRNEHERNRKILKENWHKQLKKLTEAVNALKRTKLTYIQRNQELLRLSTMGVEHHDKLDRKKEELTIKVRDASEAYEGSVREANEQHWELQGVKREVLQKVRELLVQGDSVLKTVTGSYYQAQQSLISTLPVQMQTNSDSCRLYEPGAQYTEFVRRLVYPAIASSSQALTSPFEFEAFSVAGLNSSGAVEEIQTFRQHLNSGLAGSDTDSVGSSRSTKSADGSPTSSPVPPNRRGVSQNLSSGEELECDSDMGGSYFASASSIASKAASTHIFRKLKTPARCRECDSYVYFHGSECIECGLACHKKCLEILAIKCGHKRLPRKLTTFGVDLQQHLQETNAAVPHIVTKCIKEIDARGTNIKGIYRVSGLKSRVEKLCQCFENGAHLVDLSDQHPNVIANVLKLYLRQLPEPILTFRLYNEFVRIAKEHPASSGGAEVVALLREVVRRLPPHHLGCLAALMLHLHRVASHAQLNNMPPSNLGIVFGPTLLRTAEGSASLSSLVDTVHQTKAIELLVQNAREVFGAPDEAPWEHPKGLSTSSSSSSSSSSGGGAKARLESSRLGSVQPSGGSSSSLRHPVEELRLQHRKRDEFDSEPVAPADDDWDWSSDEPFGSLPPSELLRPHSTGGGIVKTSLKDYVGLEMAALQEERLAALEIPSHPALKKSLSDNPQGRSNVMVCQTTTAPTTPTKTCVSHLLTSTTQEFIRRLPPVHQMQEKDKRKETSESNLKQILRPSAAAQSPILQQQQQHPLAPTADVSPQQILKQKVHPTPSSFFKSQQKPPSLRRIGSQEQHGGGVPSPEITVKIATDQSPYSSQQLLQHKISHQQTTLKAPAKTKNVTDVNPDRHRRISLRSAGEDASSMKKVSKMDFGLKKQLSADCDLPALSAKVSSEGEATGAVAIRKSPSRTNIEESLNKPLGTPFDTFLKCNVKQPPEVFQTSEDEEVLKKGGSFTPISILIEGKPPIEFSKKDSSIENLASSDISSVDFCHDDTSSLEAHEDSALEQSSHSGQEFATGSRTLAAHNSSGGASIGSSLSSISSGGMRAPRTPSPCYTNLTESTGARTSTQASETEDAT